MEIVKVRLTRPERRRRHQVAVVTLPWRVWEVLSLRGVTHVAIGLRDDGVVELIPVAPQS
jgi:hypothetical protein